MKRTITTLFFGLFLIVSLGAQTGRGGFDQMLDKFQDERVSFLTREMSLTTQEAQKFWPIYNEYLKKRDEMILSRKQRGMGYNQVPAMTESEIDTLINRQLDTDIRLLQLKKKYFLKIREELPAKKVMILMRAEQQFMNHMLNQMRGQGQGRRGRGWQDR